MADKNFNNILSEEIMANEEKKLKLSLFSRIIKIFTSPAEVMKDILVRPTILVPMLIILVVFLLLNILRFELIKEFVINQMEIAMAQNPNIDELPEEVTMMQAYTTFISMTIMPLVIIFFKGLVSHGIIQLFDGKGKFKASIAVVIFSYFIALFGEAIRTIIGLLVGNYMVTTSLAAVVSNLEITTPLYTLLAGFDVFSIWYLIVSMIGFSIVHRVSKSKAAVAIFVPWILLNGFNFVMAIFRGQWL